MGFGDLIPWTKGQQLLTRQEPFDPFLTLHREVNRLFDRQWQSVDAWREEGRTE